MANTRKSLIVCAVILLFAVASTNSCTLARGYFYQVTALRGQVVGIRSNFPGAFAWIRHMFTRGHAKLKLYEYRFPTKDNYPTHSLSELPFVKEVDADENGKFDFGPLKTGHYTLIIEEGQWFDVEIIAMERATISVLIDVSPYWPDCKGGREFIIRTK